MGCAIEVHHQLGPKLPESAYEQCLINLRELFMSEKKSAFHSLWFSIVMVIVSLLMLADYTRLVLTTDDSVRRIVVLIIWGVIALGWIITLIIRLGGRKNE